MKANRLLTSAILSGCVSVYAIADTGEGDVVVTYPDPFDSVTLGTAITVPMTIPTAVAGGECNGLGAAAFSVKGNALICQYKNDGTWRFANVDGGGAGVIGIFTEAWQHYPYYGSITVRQDRDPWGDVVCTRTPYGHPSVPAGGDRIICSCGTGVAVPHTTYTSGQTVHFCYPLERAPIPTL